MMNATSNNTLGCVSVRTDRQAELDTLAGPLLESPAFKRLAGVTFLGILSPRYCTTRARAMDGSRRDHSRGVAVIALDLASRLGLSEIGQRYAVAWGLLHDVATWPLSHTSEPAFERILGVAPRRLRREMILGSAAVPDCFHLPRALGAMAVEPPQLLRLFNAQSPPQGVELSLLWQIIHSPITPDTLEGMWRVGQVCGIPVPHPRRICHLLRRRGDEVIVEAGEESPLTAFWLAKSRIYRQFINRKDIAAWESGWAHVILHSFAAISLAESLVLSEKELLGRVGQPDPLPASESYRYKPPHVYFLNGEAESHLAAATVTVRDLSKYLKKRPEETWGHGEEGRAEEAESLHRWPFTYRLPEGFRALPQTDR